MIPQDPGGVIFGWLLQLFTDKVLLAAREHRKLRKAITRAVDAVLADISDDQARESLRAALAERFNGAPALSLTASGLWPDRLSQAVGNQLEPLANPENALGGASFLEQIGVSSSWLSGQLTRALINAIQEMAAAADFSTLAILLRLDELGNGLRAGNALRPPFMAPDLPATFTGRPETGIPLVEALLSDQSLGPIVVRGAGGFGKSTLAAWACHQAEVRACFPDGVLWISLGDRPDPAEQVTVLTDLILRLTGEPAMYSSVPVAADAFAAALGERRILLVIDGAWRAEHVKPLLAGGPRCVRLVTTQQSALVPGHEIEVGAMTQAEATALLGSGFPEPATEDLMPLLSRSGRMPLVLGLLNGVLHSLRDRLDMPLADAASWLADELDRRGLSAADDLAGHGAEGVKAMLALSITELGAVHGAEAASRYESLCVFPADAPVPYGLLAPVWGLSHMQTVTEAAFLLRRSLATSADRNGVRLHNVFHDVLRRGIGDRGAEISGALLETFRPADGWHALPPGHELWPQLAYHLLQAGRREELRGLLRDFRFLVARVSGGGALALESDAEACAEDPYAASLLAILRQEAHLLTGHDNTGDLALTLHSRLFSRPGVFHQVTHSAEAIPREGLVAAYPLPDCADPRLSRVITGQLEADLSLAWPPGDGLVLSLSCSGGTIRRWDPATGEQQAFIRLPGDHACVIRMSPDGRSLGVLHEKQTKDQRASQAPIHGIAGKETLPGGDVTRIERWLSVADIASGTVIAKCPAAPLSLSGLPDVSWAADSASLAFTVDHGVRLWAPFGEGEPRTLPLDPCRSADALAWHPVAGLACLADGGTLIWWPHPAVSDRRQIWDDFGKYGFRIGDYALAWGPDGQLLAMASGGRLLIVDLAERRVVREIISPAPDLAGLSWRPDGRAVSCIWNFRASRGYVVVAGVEPGADAGQPFIIGSPGSQITGAAFDPTGTYLAAATSEPVIQLWQPGAGPADDPHRHAASAVHWQPGGRLLAVTGAAPGGTVLCVVKAEAPNNPVWVAEPADPGPVAWSPDGRFLVDNHGPIAIREAETGGVVADLPAEKGYGWRTAVSWPLQGQLVTTTSYYNTVSLTDATSGEDGADVPVRRKDATGTASLDGSRIAVWSGAGGLDIVEMGTGARTVLDDEREYWCACFLPGGSQLAAVTRTGEVVLWDIGSRKVTACQRCEGAHWVAADRAGKHLAALNMTGKITLFEAPALRRICQVAIRGTAAHCDFDSPGDRLAVAGSAGLYLFQVRR
jgi:WD40 repeat protein